MVIIRAQSGENGRVAALKGLFNVRNNNKLIIFLDILTQNMLKEVMSVFSFYIFRTSFKLENDYLTSLSFRGVLTSR